MMDHDPVFPTDQDFGEFLGLQHVAYLWRRSGRHVVTGADKGDGNPAFDWLVNLSDGSVAGLEIVRAEDGDVRQDHEEWLRKDPDGAEGFATSALVPWEAAGIEVTKKSAKLGEYRASLPESAPMYLAVTGGVATGSPILYGDVHQNVQDSITAADSGFDDIYLFDGRHPALSVRDQPVQDHYIRQHVGYLISGTEGWVASEYVRHLGDGTFALNAFAPLLESDDGYSVLVRIQDLGTTIESGGDRYALALSELRSIDVAEPIQRWELTLQN